MQMIYFTLITYVIYGLACFLVIFRWKNQRDYWYALIGVSLTFPLEWFAAHYNNLMVYDSSYLMAFGRIPLWMFCAYGWFWGFPIVVCMRFQKKIDSWPLWQSIITLYSIFWVWDFTTEYSSTAYGYWVYYWPKEWMIGGILPWTIPTTVSLISVALYYTHKFLLRYSIEKGWIQGLFIHTFGYYLIMSFLMVMNFLAFRGFFGIDPTVNYFDSIRW